MLKRKPGRGTPARTPGSYLLLLELPAAATIQVGRLGAFSFPQGWYVYVGSALSGLDQRISRHLRPSGVRRWHLDYLRTAAHIVDVKRFPDPQRRECELAGAVLALPEASVPAPRFGASDCRCPAHLIHFPRRPALEHLPNGG